MQPVRKITTFALVVLLWGTGAGALAQGNPHPLAPLDLSSPRATLTNFLNFVSAAYARWKMEGGPTRTGLSGRRWRVWRRFF